MLCAQRAWLCSHVGCVCSPGTRGAGGAFSELQATCRQHPIPVLLLKTEQKGVPHLTRLVPDNASWPRASPPGHSSGVALQEQGLFLLKRISQHETPTPAQGGLPGQAGLEIVGLREEKQVPGRPGTSDGQPHG